MESGTTPDDPTEVPHVSPTSQRKYHGLPDLGLFPCCLYILADFVDNRAD